MPESAAQAFPGPPSDRDAPAKALIWALLLALCLFAGLSFARDRLATTPLAGGSPMGVVHQLAEPEHFARDFPDNFTNYMRSSFMHVYTLAHQYLGVDPEAMNRAVIVFEVLLIALALALLARVLAPGAPPELVLLVVALCVASYTPFLDIGKVGHYFHGKVNNVADALRLCALAALLAGRAPLAGVLLGLCFTANPIYACLTASFFLPVVLVRPAVAGWRSVLLGAGLFAGLSLIWAAAFFQADNFLGGAIPPDQWFELSRLCSGHWYPVDLGVLTFRHNLHFLPLLSMCLLLLDGLGRDYTPTARRMFWGFAAMVPLMALGVAAARYDLSQSLIKAQIFRADQIFLSAGMVFVVLGLVGTIRRSGPALAGVAAAALVSPFFVKPGFPLLPCAVLAGASLLRAPRPLNAAQRAMAALLAGVALLLCWYAWQGYLRWEFYPAYFGTAPLAAVAVGTGLGVWRLRGRGGRGPEWALPLALLGAACAVYWVLGFAPDQDTVRDNAQYRQVQEWAARETPGDALFMVDPTIYFGWRDFSHRSHLGNMREWLYGWVTSNDYRAYQEGMERFGAYGLDYRDYLNAKPSSIRGFFRLRKDMRERFNAPEPSWLREVVRRWGVDYVVYDKRSLKEPPALPLAFANDGYAVYATGARAATRP